jgi:O-6-methylguanine DNA methyltransferase
MRYVTVKTFWGWVAVAARYGVAAVALPCSSDEAALAALRERVKADVWVPDPCGLKDLAERLEAYFSGEVVNFSDVEIDWEGMTAFQREVLSLVRRIPYGEVRSYQWVARGVGRPQAFRAVGQTLAANRVLILVPCHRVVRKGGGLGGFSQGAEMKRRLLSLEQKAVATRA